MIRVYSVKPASGGFGQFDLSTDSATYDNIDSVDEYMSLAYSENDMIETDPDSLEEAREAADNADGNTYNQNDGVIVGFKDRDGFISLECVYLISPL